MDFNPGVIAGAIAGAVVSILIVARINGEDASLIGVMVFTVVTGICGLIGYGIGHLFSRKPNRRRHPSKNLIS